MANDGDDASRRLHPPFVHASYQSVEYDSHDEGRQLPSIDEYLAAEDTAGFADSAPGVGDDWAEAPWQSYDWTAMASLGHQPGVDADAEWETTDWGPDRDDAGQSGNSGVADGSNQPSADEVAHALDVIARRLRSGELSIDEFRETSPEAALAATIAAILKFRRR